MITLLDEGCTPSVREAIGRLMGAAQTADLAVAHIRLATLDLQPRELGSLQRCRVLLARFDSAFAADAHSLINTSTGGVHLNGLLAFAQSGHLEVRSSSTALWTPDFSIYHGLAGGKQNALLLGAHYFRPLHPGGAALTCVIRDETAVQRAMQRFEDVWAVARDVLPVITETLADALGCAGVR